MVAGGSKVGKVGSDGGGQEGMRQKRFRTAVCCCVLLCLANYDMND